MGGVPSVPTDRTRTRAGHRRRLLPHRHRIHVNAQGAAVGLSWVEVGAVLVDASMGKVGLSCVFESVCLSICLNGTRAYI